MEAELWYKFAIGPRMTDGFGTSLSEPSVISGSEVLWGNR